MNKDADRRLMRAQALWRQGELRQASSVLLELSVQYPASAAVFALLGGVYRHLRKFDLAITAFRNAARLAPKSDLPSRGLVICLAHKGRLTEAANEMRRFLSIRCTQAYREMVQEIWETYAQDKKASTSSRSGKGRKAIQEVWETCTRIRSKTRVKLVDKDGCRRRRKTK
jgi:tetratricopeptide (TPR) repeat protein